jgi:ubiquinone/menaquinone biosynthesis C-methylase UbiE
MSRSSSAAQGATALHADPLSPINLQNVADKYNSLDKIWDESDPWHMHTHNEIQNFVRSMYRKYAKPGYEILNAGSAGYSYGLPEDSMTHIDIADQTLKNAKRKIIASVEDIPVADNTYDMIICVGSVISYCDPIKTIHEFKRILKPGGCLILEFENSHTLELIGSEKYNKEQLLIDTFYRGQPERIWYYSENYIKDLLKEAKFNLKDTCRWHLLSPYIYKLTHNEKTAAKYTFLDPLLRLLPFFNTHSSNVGIVCRNGV